MILQANEPLTAETAPLSGAAARPAIRITGLGKTYRDEAEGTEHRVLKNVDLEVREGEFLILLGPSGCGKSTLLNLIAGFFPRTEGVLEVQGKEVKGTGTDRAMVFQNADSALFPWLSVRKNVEFGLKMRHLPKAERRTRAQEYIKLVGLEGHEEKLPRALSGGMKQRVQLARVLAIDPGILLMDEPFGALDAMTRRLMQKELVRIWKETRKTVIFVTHDITEAILLGERIALMSTGPDSRIALVKGVDLPYPRDTGASGFARLESLVNSCFEEGGGI